MVVVQLQVVVLEHIQFEVVLVHIVFAGYGAEIGAPLLCEIRAGVAVKEAQAFRRSLYEYAPKSKPAADYLKLYELIKF